MERGGVTRARRLELSDQSRARKTKESKSLLKGEKKGRNNLIYSFSPTISLIPIDCFLKFSWRANAMSIRVIPSSKVSVPTLKSRAEKAQGMEFSEKGQVSSSFQTLQITKSFNNGLLR